MNEHRERLIITTADGSHSLFVPSLEEHYHSTFGAIQESMHVFIANGLLKCNKKEPVVLEIGFGTGLNVLLTLLNRGEKKISYYSIEKYPLTEDEYSELNYPGLLRGCPPDLFMKIHRCKWDSPAEITSGFTLTKLHSDLTLIDRNLLPVADLVYFDAFAPAKQPEMWTNAVFEKIAACTSPGGIFVTYCSKGEVRRKLLSLGYKVQRIPGPPGKKEMLFGQKLES